MSYGPNIGPTSSEPGTITMRAGGLVAKRREDEAYFEWEREGGGQLATDVDA